MAFPIAAAIAGGAILGSGIFDYFSGKSNVKATNNANLQIARETNQANRDLYQEQWQNFLKYNQYTNEYNSPVNQVARLRSAGLNPALNYGGANTAEMASVPSAPSAVTGAPMQAYQPNISGSVSAAASAAGMFAGDTQLKQEQARGVAIDNQFKAALNTSEIANRLASVQEAKSRVRTNSATFRKLEAEEELLRQQLRVADATYSESVEHAGLENDYLRASAFSLRESVKQRDTELAIKRYEASTGRMLSEANVRHLNELASAVHDENLRGWSADTRAWDVNRREWLDYGMRSQLFEMDKQLKQLDVDAKTKQNMFNSIMMDSDIAHRMRRDVSFQNKLVEVCLGMGLDDLAGAVKNYSIGAAAVMK